jgi:D,D-heptose 1,7-bisphosphate phosphatase
MQKHAVFFDRDNTLNYDSGYIGDPSQVKLFPGVIEGIKKLRNQYKFKIIVISNQSGITRNILKESDVIAVNEKINEILKENNTEIDDFFYCPYHPDFDPPELTKCRKPSPYMIFKAADKYFLELEKCYMAGDSASDIECAINAGVKSILLNYEKENKISDELKRVGKSPDYIAVSFEDACNYIIGDFKE